MCVFLCVQKIETDETKTRQEVEEQMTGDEVTEAGQRLAQVVMSPVAQSGKLPGVVEERMTGDEMTG